MKKIRIIPRLDIKGPNVVKGIQLEGLRVVGNPSDLARRYYKEGADELIYMDIVASLYNRNSLGHIVEETIERDVFIPITVGGGIRKIEDIRALLRSGADKVAINTAAIKNPNLLREAAEVFGSSTIILSVEAKRIDGNRWEAYTDNGRERTGMDVVEWVTEAVRLGAGEILLTSVDQEGTRNGYDLDLINAVTSVVSVPVIVSGGAGNVKHVEECMRNKKVDGIALATLLHYGEWKVNDLKKSLLQQNPGRIKYDCYSHVYQGLSDEPVVSIVDYGLGNLRSVKNAFKQLGACPQMIATPEDILKAQYLVLPGVGSFGEGMRNLRKNGLDRAIIEYAQSGRPLLGICLGTQLLMTRSFEFGEHEGLNIISGSVLPFPENEKISDQGYKIPHVGWNNLCAAQSWKRTVLEPIEDNKDVYFVHSFYVKPDCSEHVLAWTDYFDNRFCSVVQKNNIVGCQFHPEKSGGLGLSILNKFIHLGRGVNV